MLLKIDSTITEIELANFLLEQTIKNNLFELNKEQLNKAEAFREKLIDAYLNNDLFKEKMLEDADY